MGRALLLEAYAFLTLNDKLRISSSPVRFFTQVSMTSPKDECVCVRAAADPPVSAI